MTRTSGQPWISTITTDRPGERVTIARSPGLDDVEFWSVSGSTRTLPHYDVAYALSHLRGRGSMTAEGRYRGRERVVGAGHVQLTEPGEIHCMSGAAEPAAFFVAWLSPRLVARLVEES